MKKQHNKLHFLLISLFISLNVASQIKYVATDGTGDYNCDGISDQVQINAALDFVANNADYTTVYLKGPNTYIIDEPVLISSNTILTGDTTVILKLQDYIGWVENKPLITQTGRIDWDGWGHVGESIENVEIYGFEISAGLQSEPSGARFYAIIHFTYPNNISIHDMYMHDNYWDIVRLTSSGGVDGDVPQDSGNSIVYNNIIVRSGHEGVCFVGMTNYEVYENEIYSTRTNCGIRNKDCNNFSNYNNIIGNDLARSSSGYAGIIIENDHTPLDVAEVYNNVIYGKNGGIHLGSDEEESGEPYLIGTRANVHIHHNFIYKCKDMETSGTYLMEGGIRINAYHNTLIEHNIIDGGTKDGIFFTDELAIGTGYETIVRNNIIINNEDIGINNRAPTSVHNFIVNNNLVYNNGTNYVETTATNDINENPLFASNNNTLNQWYHIVATYDNTSETMKIYVDGLEKTSRTFKGLFGTIGTNTYNLFLGTSHNGSYKFDGYQDELALWNRSLSETEVSLLYNNGSPENIDGALSTDIQAYFKMENNWNDSSGNNYNAETNTATFTTNAINGNYAGLFDGNTGVQYPNTLSTANGFSISVWIYRTSLDEEIQTILNKGKESDNDLIWLYYRDETIRFELGNGTDRTSIYANILDPQDMDFHVKSAYGRWNGTDWINDTETSPCMDGGDPTSDLSNEPNPNGGIVNIGIYGNTTEASKSDTISVNEYNNTDDFVIYPNPASDVFLIKNIDERINYVSIYNQQGQMLFKKNVPINSIEVSQFSKGIYFVILQTNSECICKKLIIK